MASEKPPATAKDFGVTQEVFDLARSMFEFEYPRDKSWPKRYPGDVAAERYLRLASHAWDIVYSQGHVSVMQFIAGLLWRRRKRRRVE